MNPALYTHVDGWPRLSPTSRSHTRYVKINNDGKPFSKSI